MVPESTTPQPFSGLQVAFLILAILLHVALSLHGSLIHSPSWDEVGHLAAGIEHWEYGTFELYKVNPPLPRMIAVLPIVLTEHPPLRIPNDLAFPHRPEWFAGLRLVESVGSDIFPLLTRARWMLLPLSLLGMCVCVRWARAIGGNGPAICAAWLWAIEPNILAATQLITPDLAATSLGMLMFWRFRAWLWSPGWNRAAIVGLCLGAALLCKSTWLVAWPMMVGLWAAVRGIEVVARVRRRFANRTIVPKRDPPPGPLPFREGEKRPVTLRRQFDHLCLAGLMAVVVVNAGYGFAGSFRLLREFEFFSRPLHGQPAPGVRYETGNMFRGTPFTNWPAPFPAAYIEGIDFQRDEFERGYPSYLLGEHRHGGWWYFYVLVLLWKVPLGMWGLLVVGGVTLARNSVRSVFRRDPPPGPLPGREGEELPRGWRDLLLLTIPPLVLLVLISSHTGFNHHLRYLLPMFPFGIVIAAQAFAGSVRERVPNVATFRDSAAQPELRPPERSPRPPEGSPHPPGNSTRPPVLAVACLGWAIFSSLAVHPHHLSYFNELVGGPAHGFHAAGLSDMDSLFDWQQDTLLLKRWIDDHPDTPLNGIAIRGFRSINAAAGLPDVTPPSGRIPERGDINLCEIGPLPGWYAVSVKDVYGGDDRYRYFSHLEPVGRAGHTILIYHIAPDDADRLWRQLHPELPNRDCLQWPNDN